MLNVEELEQFLAQLLQRGQALGPQAGEQLQHLAHEGAQALHAKLTEAEATPQPGAVEETADQVVKLPTPPKPKENREGLFDPQRDTSPG